MEINMENLELLWIIWQLGFIVQLFVGFCGFAVICLVVFLKGKDGMHSD